MKTAVSIPEELFRGADQLARNTKGSRSRIFRDALRGYLARHSPDGVTEAMNRACTELGASQGRVPPRLCGFLIEQNGDFPRRSLLRGSERTDGSSCVTISCQARPVLPCCAENCGP